MSLFDKLFGNKEESKPQQIPTSKDMDKNIEKIKEILVDCDDVVYRDFNVGIRQKHRFTIIFTDGMIDKVHVTENVLKALMQEAREVPPEPSRLKHDLLKLVQKGSMSATEVKEIETITEAVDNILVGETVLLIENYDKLLVIGSRGWPTRGVAEPQSETVIRGPRDGFTETLRSNASLVRRRIRDPKLKLKNMQVGTRSKTDICIMYIEDIVNEEVLKEVKTRLDRIEIDAILESSYIEQLIEDNYLSPFPQVENTEKPDSVAASLYEGRVAILVDNTPFALLAPTTIQTLLQSSEDYYNRWVIGSLIRVVRYFAMVVALLAPATYIAITSFHPGMLPTQLALYIASTRAGVPFPAFVEAFIMEITIEFLREAGTRLSGPIGTTIGIVGGLVIGSAAVEAGIVSPLMVIIVAVTAIASFMLPNYGFASGFRALRFLIMAAAAAFGFYGIMLALILIVTHMVNLKSFGVPFMTPFVDYGEYGRDIGDSFFRKPLRLTKKRPGYIETKNQNRQPKDDNES